MKGREASIVVVLSGLTALTTAVEVQFDDVPVECASICGPIVELSVKCNVDKTFDELKKREVDDVVRELQPLPPPTKTTKERRDANEAANEEEEEEEEEEAEEDAEIVPRHLFRRPGQNNNAPGSSDSKSPPPPPLDQAAQVQTALDAQEADAATLAFIASLPFDAPASKAQQTAPPTSAPAAKVTSLPTQAPPPPPPPTIAPTATSAAPTLAQPAPPAAPPPPPPPPPPLQQPKPAQSLPRPPSPPPSTTSRPAALPVVAGSQQQQQGRENAEKSCTCANRSFNVQQLAGLCQSCIKQAGGQSNGLDFIMQECNFTETRYMPADDNLADNIQVVAQNPLLTHGGDVLGGAGRVGVGCGAAAAMVVSLVAGMALLLL